MNRTIAILFAGAVLAAPGFGAPPPTSTTTKLQASVSSINLGQPLTLTATVNPVTGGGNVTFYNGTSVLGIAPVSGTTAVLQTIFFSPSPTGAPFSLGAHYDGNAGFSPSSTTTAVLLTVLATPSQMFIPATLSPPSVSHVGSAAKLVQADFNQDGIMDFAVYGSNGIVIALGNGSNGSPGASGTNSGPGNGTFTLQNSGQPLSGSQACLDLVQVDFNGDGHPDLGCYRVDQQHIDVFTGNGDGSFSSTVTTLQVESDATAVVGTQPGAVLVAADFNGDGAVDIAVPVQIQNFCTGGFFTSFCNGSAVDVFLGNGNGTFQAVKSSQIYMNVGSLFFGGTTGTDPIAMAAGDFNSDGKLDLVVMEIGSAGVTHDLVFLPGGGSGTFTVSGFLGAPGVFFLPQLVSANFDGTGPSREVAYRDITGNVNVAIGPGTSGSGTFAFVSTAIPGFNGLQGYVTIGDFDGNGNLDLAGDFQGVGAFQVFYGSGNGKFQNLKSVANCGTAVYPVSFNYNGDNRSDIAAVCTNNNLTVELGSPPPTVSAVSPATAAVGGNNLSLALTGTGFQSGDKVTWTPSGGSATTGIPTTLNANGTLTVNFSAALATSLLAATGPVTLDVADPSGVSSATAKPNFTIIAPPAISSIAPTSVGAGSPAFPLTITGTGFVNGDCVTWTQVQPNPSSPVPLTGTAPCATAVSGPPSQQQITVTVPANLLAVIGSASISVTDPDGAPSSTPQTISVVAPSITGLADSTGAPLTSVGTASTSVSITINGTNFVTGTPSTESLVVFTTPSGAVVTLPPVSVTTNQIVVKVPGQDTGNIANTTAQVQVLNQVAGGICTAPGLGVGSPSVVGACSSPFTLAIGAPKITSFNPPAATNGNNPLTLVVNGSNFVDNSQLVWCNPCNGLSATVIAPTPPVAPSQMTVTIPGSLLSAPGTAQIAITNTPANLTDPNTNSAAMSFQIAALSIATLSPASVIAGGPDFNLTITGQNSNFLPGAQVLFGNGLANITPAPNQIVNNNQITVTVPAAYIASPGSLSIQVQDANGTTTPPVQLPIQTFSISSVAPLNLIAGGPDATLTISGSGFGPINSMQVQWIQGPTTATLPILTDNNGVLTVKVSGGAQGLLAQPGTAQIQVLETLSSSPNPFTATFNQLVTVAGPMVSSITPTSSLVNGNAFQLDVKGSNFLSNSTIEWTSSTGTTTPLATTFVSSAELTTFVPSTLLAVTGTQTAQVTVTNGSVNSNGVVFQIGPVPTINTDGSGVLICPTGASCTPAASITAGTAATTLQINGQNYQSGATVIWTENGTSANLVTAFQSSTTLMAVLPASLLSAIGNALITVQDPGPPASTSNGVLFAVGAGPTPVLTSVTAVGNVILGSPVQLAITGSFFTNSAQVQWNNGTTTTGLATVFADANDLTAVVPANLVAAPGTVTITVQSAGATSNPKPFTIPPITITSIAPVNAAANSGPLTLTVMGSGFTSNSVVQWTGGAGPQALSTTLVFNNELSAIVPNTLLAAAGTAFVSVVTGTQTTNAESFAITSTAPTIATNGTGLAICPGGTSCSAANSVVAGSASIILQVTGTNYQPGSAVVWTVGGNATNLTTSTGANPGTNLLAVVPASLMASPATALITVQNPDKTISNGVLFTVGTGQTPTIAAVTAVGPVVLGSPAQLAITGANFAPGSLVEWSNGTTTTGLATSFIDATDLSATVPANLIAAPGTVQITVQSGGATSAPTQFTIPTITISALTPNMATAGSAAVLMTVAGGNFTSASTVQWNVNGTPTALSTTLISATQLTALVPAAQLASAGTAYVTVATGTLSSNALPFTVQSPNPPAIGSLTPNAVQAGSGGTQVTVIGSNFVNGAVVQWNVGGTAQPLTSAFVSSTQLSALIPATLVAAPATAFLSVQNPNGGGLSNLVAFTISAVGLPTIASLSPASVDAGATGVTLTIAGTNLVNGSVVVWNNGTAAPLATGFNSSTQLTALVPASLLALPGTALISVQNPDKSMTNSLAFAITGSAPVTTPTLTSISPTSAAAGSSSLQLTVTGQNFVGPSTTAAGTVVQWNGTAIPTTFSSTTQLVATVDASLLQAVGANFVSVVTGPNSSAGVKFQVNGPTLTAVAPASATAGGPAFSLTLTGTNFVSGSVALWNTTKLLTAVNSGTSLTAQVMPDLIATAGSAFIMVTNPGGAATGPQIFTISTPPSSTVTTLSPPSAIAGGAAFQLTVNGTGFVNGSVVMWNGSPIATGFISATQITALIDSSLIATAGNANVAVQNPGAAMSTAVKFPINGPTVTTLTPSTANAGDPGFTLTVAGTNFIPGAAVLWNGSILPTLYSAATQLQATVPATLIASAGTAAITVQNAGGATSGSLTFTIGPPSLHITTAVLPDGVVGTAYSQVLVALGGSLPYAWTVSSGNLPGGLGLDPASGTISGTPTGAANGTIGFTVTDAAGRIAKVSLQLNIAQALTITTPSPLAMATAGTAYSAQLAATGGTPSYLWSIAGNLPPGLIFTVATGRISGVPTAPGSYTFTIGVTDSREQQNATATFTLPVTVAALNVSGLNTTVGPAQQVPLTVSVPNAYSVDLTGTLTLTFASAVGGDDPSIQFSTVGRTVTFTIPNGTTTAVYPQNQQLLVSTGTVAGTITIKATLQAAGSDITPSGLTPITATVPKQVPVITSLTLKQTTGGVVVAITGYTTTKEVTQATLQFNAVSGGSLNSGTTTVPLTAVINSWFQSAPAAAFGGQFTVSIPIAVSGTVNAIGSVTVTVTNTQGNSAPVTAPLQ